MRFPIVGRRRSSASRRRDRMSDAVGDALAPASQFGADVRAPVAACARSAHTRACHQLSPGPRGTTCVPPALLGRSLKPKPGSAVHHVEGVFGGTAVRDRVGQRPDDALELQYRTGPTVRQHQRKASRSANAPPERDIQTTNAYDSVYRIPSHLHGSPVMLPQASSKLADVSSRYLAYRPEPFPLRETEHDRDAPAGPPGRARNTYRKKDRSQSQTTT